MKKKQLFLVIIIFLIVITGCSTNTSDNTSADWAFSFVVWNDYIYRVSDDYVDDIGKEIGEVTKYSDLEGTYSGNFSNEYPRGTKYYSIKGKSTDEAIAIEEKGKYRIAIRSGKYGEK